jgi:cytochrome c-type biogenesis protein
MSGVLLVPAIRCSLAVLPVMASGTPALAGATGVALTIAFGAGVLSPLNPCGFALLPAYVSHVLSQSGTDHQRAGWSQVLRGGLLGLPLAAGFLLVFLIASGTLALGGRALVALFPWLAILVGVGLVALGSWMVFPGHTLEAPGLGTLAVRLGAQGGATAKPRPGSGRAWYATWGFGLGYGLSSLGCTLPVFLLVVGSAATAGGVGGAVLVLAAYAAGITLVLLAVAMAATALRDLLRQTVLPLLRWVQPLAALLLIAAGIYIVLFQFRTGLL